MARSWRLASTCTSSLAAGDPACSAGRHRDGGRTYKVGDRCGGAFQVQNAALAAGLAITAAKPACALEGLEAQRRQEGLRLGACRHAITVRRVPSMTRRSPETCVKKRLRAAALARAADSQRLRAAATSSVCVCVCAHWEGELLASDCRKRPLRHFYQGPPHVISAQPQPRGPCFAIFAEAPELSKSVTAPMRSVRRSPASEGGDALPSIAGANEYLVDRCTHRDFHDQRLLAAALQVGGTQVPATIDAMAAAMRAGSALGHCRQQRSASIPQSHGRQG